jgi:hypothetical protein
MVQPTDPFDFLQGIRSDSPQGINSDLESLLTSARRTRANRFAQKRLAQSENLQLQQQQREIQARSIVAGANVEPAEGASFLSRVGTILDLPAKHIARPAMGYVLEKVFQALPGEQEGEAELRKVVGANPFSVFVPEQAEKVRTALKETDLPFGVHTAMEIALDPLTYVPVGGAIKVIKGGRQAIGLVAPAAREATKHVGRLTPLAERIDLTLPDNNMRKLGERLSTIPVVKQVIGVFNPSAAAHSDVGRNLIGYAQLMEDSEGLVSVSVSNLAGRTFPFQKTRDGHILLDGKRQMAWGDLFQQSAKPEVRSTLSKPQIEFMDEYTRVLREAREYLDDAGIKVKDLGFAPGEQFIPRFVLGKDNIDKMTANIGTAVGSKPAFMQSRYYTTMEEGVEHGVNYADPIETLAQHLRGVYRVIADDELVRAIRPLGRTTGITERQKLLERTALSRVKRIDRMDEVLKGALTQGKLAPQTLAALKRTDNEIGAALEQAIKMPLRADRIREINGLRARVAGLKIEADEAAKFLKNDMKEARRLARTKRIGERAEGRIAQPGFGGRLFPKEVSDEVNKFFGDRAQRFETAMANINSVARLGLTGFDFGAGMIQGLPLLVRNPAGWVRAQTAAMQALRDPQAMSRYADKHSATIQEMARFGGSVNVNEWVEAGLRGGIVERGLRPGGVIARRIPVVGAPTATGLRFGSERAAAAFSQLGLAARVEWYEAMRPVVMRKVGKGGLTEEQALQQLTETVGKMTGISGKARLAIGPSRAAWERGLLFAPTYLRSSLGLLTDMFQGGLRGELARESTMKLMASGLLFYYGWSAALGQEPKLNPSRADFLTVEIAGQRVGFGSIWISLARSGANIYTQVDPDNKYRDPSGLISSDPEKSALARFTRSKASPLIGLGWDVVQGRDVMGAPVGNPIEQPLEFLKDMPSYLAPFWLQQYIDNDLPIPGEARAEINLPAEIFGMRSFPSSMFQERDVRRDALAQAHFTSNWDDLSFVQKKVITEGDERLKFFDQQISAFRIERGDDLDKQVTRFFVKQDEFQETRRGLIENAGEEWEKGRSAGREWRERVINAGRDTRVRFQDLHGPSSDFAAAIARIAEFDDPTVIEDIAFDEYRQRIIVGAPELDGGGIERELFNAFGEMDYDERKRREDDVHRRYGEKVFETILVRLRIGHEDQPLLTEWHDGLNLFRNYWEIGNDIAADRGATDMWKQFKNFESQGLQAEVDRMEQQMPILVKIKGQVREIRQRMRQSSPALDAFLLKYGYTTTAQTPTVRRLTIAEVQKAGFDVLALPID